MDPHHRTNGIEMTRDRRARRAATVAVGLAAALVVWGVLGMQGTSYPGTPEEAARMFVASAMSGDLARAQGLTHPGQLSHVSELIDRMRLWGFRAVGDVVEDPRCASLAFAELAEALQGGRWDTHCFTVDYADASGSIRHELEVLVTEETGEWLVVGWHEPDRSLPAGMSPTPLVP